MDGGGIRYAVYLAGCPLRCAYCHNPETWAADGAIEVTPEQLNAKVKKYKAYFGKDGGVTFSGGEPLLQAEFVAAAQALLKKEGIECAIDTSGAVGLDENVKKAVLSASLIILDVKFYNKNGYNTYCGDGAAFEKMLALGDYCAARGKSMLLRTVIAEGINDREDDIKRYAALASRWKGAKYELLAFHTLGFPKYEAYGIANPMKDSFDFPKERLRRLQSIIDEALSPKFADKGEACAVLP